jgi:ribonuclease R
LTKILKNQFEKIILQFLDANPGKIYKNREMAKKLGAANTEYQLFKKTVRKLAEEERITRYKGNKYGKLKKADIVTGTLHVKTQGYGFLVRDDGGQDVFINPKNMSNAAHHDCVKVMLLEQPVKKLPEGKVVEIVTRGHDKIVGTFHENRTGSCVIPDESKISRDIFISVKNRGKAQDGQKVVTEIIRWGELHQRVEGKIIDILGHPGDPGVDILSVLHRYDLPEKIPAKIIKAAEEINSEISRETLEARLDLRDKLIFTIDPEDAKDFDDAISLEKLPNGNFLLGVHIADVSHYVEPASPIDVEALKRGTSVYLVDRVLPMLPERLSNEICSLKPGEDRLTYSVLMELSSESILKSYRIRESIIHSKARFSYRQVQHIIDALKSPDRDDKFDDPANALPFADSKSKQELFDVLPEMVRLAEALRDRWEKSGSIDFEAPEPKVVLDKNNHPVELGVRERLESHKLIEAFMLLANRTVAEHIQKLRQQTGKKFSFVYRVHERPKGKKLEEFTRFTRALGYKLDSRDKITPKQFQRLLHHFRGTRHEIILEEVALRTMMKAVYSTHNVGHFGLAFKHYTHFTSPIRRYPDLVVHRLLKSYHQDQSRLPQLPTKLGEICEIANEREIVAQEAERESIRAKQVEFMEDHLGEEFDGILSGVTSFGIFVEIPQYLVEGLVHISDLKDDYYVFDEKNYRLVGQNGNAIYRLGDLVRVRVAKVLKEMRKIDFVLAEPGRVSEIK